MKLLILAGILSCQDLINTHHHFYQTLTRAVPAAQDANLFNWLKTLYPIWARMTSADICISTQNRNGGIGPFRMHDRFRSSYISFQMVLL